MTRLKTFRQVTFRFVVLLIGKMYIEARAKKPETLNEQT